MKETCYLLLVCVRCSIIIIIIIIYISYRALNLYTILQALYIAQIHYKKNPNKIEIKLPNKNKKKTNLTVEGRK